MVARYTQQNIVFRCANSPCLNNGICRPYLIDETEHKYNCSCPNGYHGRSCETVTTMSLTGTSSIIVNMPRDEGYDIQFRFKTTLGMCFCKCIEKHNSLCWESFDMTSINSLLALKEATRSPLELYPL